MGNVSISDLTAPRVPQQSSSVPLPIEAGITDYVVGTIRSDPAADEGMTLLLAALDEIEVRRAALEWLLDADLLCRCLV